MEDPSGSDGVLRVHYFDVVFFGDFCYRNGSRPTSFRVLPSGFEDKKATASGRKKWVTDLQPFAIGFFLLFSSICFFLSSRWSNRFWVPFLVLSNVVPLMECKYKSNFRLLFFLFSTFGSIVFG